MVINKPQLVLKIGSYLPKHFSTRKYWLLAPLFGKEGLGEILLQKQ